MYLYQNYLWENSGTCLLLDFSLVAKTSGSLLSTLVVLFLFSSCPPDVVWLGIFWTITGPAWLPLFTNPYCMGYAYSTCSSSVMTVGVFAHRDRGIHWQSTETLFCLTWYEKTLLRKTDNTSAWGLCPRCLKGKGTLKMCKAAAQTSHGAEKKTKYS